MNHKYKKFVTVQFPNNKKEYHFGTNDEHIDYGRFVVVETSNGIELAETTSQPLDVSKLPGKFELKPILRIANNEDINNYKKSEKMSERALSCAEKHIKDLKLDMNLISASYTLDHSKVLIVYVAEGRVDFRELLKRLNGDLRCRIELRQIGARDKAKIVGSVASCGMETCCTRFMQDFEMVSINMAKNQNLALNIPKLSGMCGKFKCCLRHEDDLYTELKEGMPEVGDRLMLNNNLYTVNSLNLVSGQMRLVNDEEVIMSTVEDAVINNPQFKTKEQLYQERQKRSKKHEQKGRARNAKNQ